MWIATSRMGRKWIIIWCGMQNSQNTGALVTTPKCCRIHMNKVPPPVADSALFTCVTFKCNVSFAKCFENFGNHLPRGMAMIVSPFPLVDIVPDLSIQKFVLRILCMDTVWNDIFTVIPTFVQSACQLYTYVRPSQECVERRRCEQVAQRGYHTSTHPTRR